MFTANCVLLCVLMKSWCMLLEDCDNAKTCRNYVIQYMDCRIGQFLVLLTYLLHGAESFLRR